MVQRRLRAGTGVEQRPSAGRGTPQENLRKAAGDRLVTSHRLKPRPAVLTPCTPAEMWVGSKKRTVVWTQVRREDAESQHIVKRSCDQSQNLSKVIRLLDIKATNKALTFRACLGSLGGLVGPTRSLGGGLSKIRQDTV